MVARCGSPADADTLMHGQHALTTESWSCILG